MCLLLSGLVVPLETIDRPLMCLAWFDGIKSKIFSDLFVSQAMNGFSRKHSNPVHHMFIDISGDFWSCISSMTWKNPPICKSEFKVCHPHAETLRPSETYMVENSIKLTPFKTITLELYSVQTSMEEPSIDSIKNTVYFGLLSRPSED